ncbi:MAG: D-sedoheptulose 7-phosphate isomerase [Bacteroidetes bacterium]|nr:D-sedoheptulose 7-phosphate isomerase [Bacteroidota bacterium]
MDYQEIVANEIFEHNNVIKNTIIFAQNEIIEISKIICKSLVDGGTIFWCGNGGSAADSQHMAAEFVGRFKKNRKALRSLALTTDTSVLTCVANDYSYQDIFSRQIEGLSRPGDVIIGLSTSGESLNVIRAFEVAKSLNLTTIAFIGKNGGELKTLSDYTLHVKSNTTARIQETHIFLGHIICNLVEHEMGLA